MLGWDFFDIRNVAGNAGFLGIRVRKLVARSSRGIKPASGWALKNVDLAKQLRRLVGNDKSPYLLVSKPHPLFDPAHGFRTIKKLRIPFFGSSSGP
jgi:hypothetical protein